ncbi:hypothetical protein HDV00_009249 [Rhizophlyctis rosea]|nr:hypothetical protein HDV00_009249 [Rhizophlyctis rosea]
MVLTTPTPNPLLRKPLYYRQLKAMTIDVPTQLPRAQQIAHLLKLINQSGEQLIQILQNGEDLDSRDGTGRLVSECYHNASRTMIASLGLMQDVVREPADRLLELVGQYHESSAMHILADLRIPDVLAEAGDEGMPVSELAERVKVEPNKLARVMRMLATNHVVRETSPDTFANGRVSGILIDNLPLTSYVRVAEFFHKFGAHLKDNVLDPTTGPSFSPWQTAFQKAANTDKAFWEWLEETDKGGKKRPELKIFGLGMVGHGKLHDRCQLFDYPWGSLGAAKVVDVGGGVGGLCMDLYEQYPELTFVVQDRPPVLEQAKGMWSERFPEYEKRVTLMPQDFMQENAVNDADVYVLRCVLHDWPSQIASQILTTLAASIPSTARILLIEQVLQPSTISPDSNSPLPKNFGTFSRIQNIMDLTMMSCVNGIERTEAEYRGLCEGAGLIVEKVWETRGPLSFVEVRKA